jgi:hypothetical protein
MTETLPPIVVQQSFNVPKAMLWDAITKRDQMIQWFFEDIPEFKAEVGFTTQFNVCGRTGLLSSLGDHRSHTVAENCLSHRLGVELWMCELIKL